MKQSIAKRILALGLSLGIFLWYSSTSAIWRMDTHLVNLQSAEDLSFSAPKAGENENKGALKLPERSSSSLGEGEKSAGSNKNLNITTTARTIGSEEESKSSITTSAHSKAYAKQMAQKAAGRITETKRNQPVRRWRKENEYDGASPTKVLISDAVNHRLPRSIPLSILLSQNQNLSLIDQAKEKSSVNYFTCCGLGHRISKLVDAHYVAKQFQFGLRVFWGSCEGPVDIFTHFFGTQPLDELENVTSTGLVLRINNEAPGFKKLIRDGNETDCHHRKCPVDVIQEHHVFYEKLRDRFTYSEDVNQFRTHHFSNYTVIGIHIRAGNGEGGDFVKKGRGINNTDSWISNTSRHLIKLSKSFERPPRLFVATDTPSLIEGFRKELKGHMDVVDYEQTRMAEGEGVLMGQHGKYSGGEMCLSGWKDALMDMMILSYADIVVAGRPSSFTQSLPIHIALSRPMEHRLAKETYCEMNPNATIMRCYEDFHTWCCRGTTDFHLEGIRRYEFRRMPFELHKQLFEVLPRPTPVERDPQRCNQNPRACSLPYDWSNP